ncbi:MAG: hypothetical protein GYA30_11175 [Chloroflexi bacterium]|nr:hypothetical protein [Chloroflexota bacterium]
MDGTDDWWVVFERPFHSDKPLIGGIIIWFRQLWNSVATQWYVRPLLEQQNEINRQLVLELARVREEVSEVSEEVSVEQTIASALDQEQADLRRQTTEMLLSLTEELHELRRRVEQLEQRLPGSGDAA